MNTAEASDSHPLVEIIVLNFNGRRWLPRCLESLSRQSYAPYHITIWDNASSDDSVEFVRAAFPAARVLTSRQNLGFSRAYNLAIRRSSAPLVALLNQDAFVETDWLEHLVAALLSDPCIAACTSRIRFADQPSRLQHTGSTLTYAGTGWDRSFGQVDRPTAQCIEPVGGFSGAAALVRRSAFLQVGGFDDRFFAFCEDTDVSWRLWLAGYRICYVPQALVYHVYGGTGGSRRSSFRLYHAQRNRIASFGKNLGASRLPLAIALSLAFDLYRSAVYLRDRRPDLVWALVAGTLAALRDLPAVLAQRRHIQQHRVIRDSDLVRLGVLASPIEAIREYLRLESLFR